jgi:membrane-associated phospholipid phosphatase
VTVRVRTPVLAAGAALAGLALLWIAAHAVGAGAHLDIAALQGFTSLEGGRSGPASRLITSLADPAPFALIGVALVLVAAARRRYRTALAVPVILIGANATTQLLKPLMADPRVLDFLDHAQIPAASWPSGHSTGAMSLALCAVLVAAPRWRPAVAVAGAAFAAAVGYGLMTLGWHYPSDVLGGYLVAAVWTLGGVAALRAADARWPERRGRDAGRAAVAKARASVTLPAAAIAGLAVAGLAVVVWRPGSVAFHLREHTAFAFSVPAVALLATLLATGLATALRR